MRFFFYGTLVAGSGNAVARAVHSRLVDLGPATVRGALHAVPDPDGWYPALVSGEGAVHGRLYRAGDGFSAGDLARMDAYEDFDPADPAGSLYVREAMAVLSGGRELEAQAYRFAVGLPVGSRPIPGGDFAAWLAEHGLRAYGSAL